MLSFDDVGLARIVIAASRVPRDMRGPWLERLAAKLEPTPAARRARAYRRRQRAGRLMIPVAVDGDVLTALIASGLIAESAARDRRKVSEVLGRQLAVWADAFK